MLWRQSFHGFQLNYYFAFNQQISEVLSNNLSAKPNQQRNPWFGLDALLTQSDEQSVLIDALKKSGSELSCHLEASLKYLPCKFLVQHSSHIISFILFILSIPVDHSYRFHSDS